ncbi:MAG TPA: NADP-dependent isocitrate dehydrogenase [Bacteroidetes bacterium]|nr:NADP-dependent isocitrate dehydrogenase [Bacteroidota bacterium]
MRISVAKGDGIGPEIMDAVLQLFEAAKVPLKYDFIEMGKTYFLQGYNSGMTPSAKESIENNCILFKGPMETPKGKGMKSINVTARKTWSTYANRRHFLSLKGVDTVHSKAGIPIDITIVRENIEDTYGGVEHMNSNDVAVCRRFITRKGSEQVHRFAFEMARKEGFKKVSCGHKANIMKLTDGLFLETFYEVAAEYPEIEANDIIVDDLCMKLVAMPQRFEVVVLPNLQGDIVSDLCAGLVGGLGFAPSSNIGDNICIFEAVHGTAPDIAGKNIANPTSLLLSGIMMLRHLGLGEKAAEIENALLYTLEQGVHTGDFGDRSIPASNTTEFTQAIIQNLGKKPEQSEARVAGSETQTWNKPALPLVRPMMVSPRSEGEKLVGCDLMIDSEKKPEEIADIIERLLPDPFRLLNISNRGTQVWPTGSILTECVNHHGCRIMLHNKDSEVSSQEIWAMIRTISNELFVTSMEMLRNFGEKQGYSLAQGQ